MLIEPSDILRNKAKVAGATGWLHDLPSLVDTLSSERGFTADHGFVSTGLLGTKLGLQPFGRDMLAVSDVLAEASAK